MSREDTAEIADESPRPPRDLCFVIMPFGGVADRYYIEIYTPAIIAGNLEPRRAADLYRPGTVIDDIWTMTRDAKVILADLSGRNET